MHELTSLLALIRVGLLECVFKYYIFKTRVCSSASSYVRLYFEHAHNDKTNMIMFDDNVYYFHCLFSMLQC